MVFLEILQSSQKNSCTRVSFLIKLQACNFIKKETLAHVFSYEFYEHLRTPFLQNTSVAACGAYSLRGFAEGISRALLPRKHLLVFKTSWRQTKRLLGSKVCQFQQIFMKKFSYILFLFVCSFMVKLSSSGWYLSSPDNECIA